MAIDTENKRRSAGAHIIATVYPIPDTDIDSSDQIQIAWLYRGSDIVFDPVKTIFGNFVEDDPVFGRGSFVPGPKNA